MARKMQRVPPCLLELEENKNDYFPMAVSFGPYHHGEEKLAFVEAFKPEAVNLFVAGDQVKNEDYYYQKVLGIIDEIRECYETASCKFSYDDAYLARMMLRDASLIIILMELSGMDARLSPDELMKKKSRTTFRHLGRMNLEVLSRDLHLLENQIPLKVIELLIEEICNQPDAGRKFIDSFIYHSQFGMHRKEEESNVPKKKKEPPLHLLEAFHRILSSKVEKAAPTQCACKFLCCSCSCSFSCSGEEVEKQRQKETETETGRVGPESNNPGLLTRLGNILGCKKRTSFLQPKNDIKKSIPKFRAATDLKAKGICFRPSPSYSLQDVNFIKSPFFNAWLELPICGVANSFKVFYKNMIAYEIIPHSPAGGEISSYIRFMNSLIEKPEDVKELREKEILCNMLGSDEEVLNAFKDINTHGVGYTQIFEQVRDQIHAHSKSKIKTWMAELIHTNFRSPWTVSAFVAAVILLAISVAQLYFAMYPPAN